MSKTLVESRIEHLVAVLEARREDYSIFGKTSEDAERDEEILAEIADLEQRKREVL